IGPEGRSPPSLAQDRTRRDASHRGLRQDRRRPLVARGRLVVAGARRARLLGRRAVGRRPLPHLPRPQGRRLVRGRNLRLAEIRYEEEPRMTKPEICRVVGGALAVLIGVTLGVASVQLWNGAPPSWKDVVASAPTVRSASRGILAVAALLLVGGIATMA